MFNKWDASDFEDDEYVALEDLKQDFDKDPYNLIPDKPNGDDVDVYNAVVFGWADNLNRNGLSYLNWYYAIGSEDPINNPANWPENSVFQHELSHNFNASDPRILVVGTSRMHNELLARLSRNRGLVQQLFSESKIQYNGARRLD